MSGNAVQLHKRLYDKADVVIQVIVYLGIVMLSLLIILPCMNVLALSFNDGGDAARGGVFFWPRVFTFANFLTVFRDGRIMRAYGITVSRTVVGTLATLAATTLTAFVLKEKDLPGRRIISFLVTFTMLFGGGLIPTYIQYNRLHLLNSFWVYIVPGLLSVVHIMMMRTFFETIPGSLQESAMLDGCGYFEIYWRITLPLSKSVIAVIALYSGVGHWNDWFSGAFFMNTDRLWPVQTVLQQMLARAMSATREVSTVSQAIAKTAGNVTSDALKMAAVVITATPIICIYPFIQKYFTKGVMIGAVKG